LGYRPPTPSATALCPQKWYNNWGQVNAENEDDRMI